MKASIPPQRMRNSFSSDQTPTFAAAFLVEDAAQRWSKPVAFSGHCEMVVDTASDSFVMQHKGYGWRIVFPMESKIKRLVPCQSCRLNRTTTNGRLCDDSLPCRVCQQQGSSCTARDVLLTGTQAIDGDAEMEAAAEEASLIEPYCDTFAFFAWSLGTDEPNTYEGYFPMPTMPETPVRGQDMLPSRMLPSTPTAAPLTPRNMRPVTDSELRRSNRIQGQKDRVDDTPVPRRRRQPLRAAQCLERMRQLTAVGHFNLVPASAYSLEQQHPPSTVDLGGLELTMAEISVFLLNLAHRPEGAMRLVNSGWQPHHFCSYHNHTRGLKGETRARGEHGEGAMRSTITKSIQKTMRLIADDNHWTQSHHVDVVDALHPDRPSTADWAPLVDDPPDHSLRSMGSRIVRWPPESHSLNLTRAVRFAVEHPHVPDHQLRFPTHVRAVVERLPGGFRSMAAEASAGVTGNLDRSTLKEWEAFQEAQGL
ncbi:uncharacterized protein BKCO1_15000128 [Diplodia corticola]|uniref:Uncharacterized protein n=1 Tax=Diplodia corticola TaxID=236234 RepID=A0A1J9S5A6_9PEZI|nr:uncharacterized protein BKCO1_15000128 [Diplodia corticola]OJD35695.1 hypothetical protein BKCO1_15000128 [Diplodia corticola]